MKMTISDVMSRINQALNYPAIDYDEVYPYFDMAIVELNTSLHISLKLISQCVLEFRREMSKPRDNMVVLTTDPSLIVITEYNNETVSTATDAYIYNTDEKKFGVKYADVYVYYDTLYGVHNVSGTPEYYQAVHYADGGIFVHANYNPLDLDLTEYLPTDWIILYLIPYVCFKYSCRDGGTGTVFSEEFTQGFQQLQESYDVPEMVLLSKYAGMFAYKEDVEKHIPYLNVYVPTKAIVETMKHPRNVQGTYGSMYDRGGW